MNRPKSKTIIGTQYIGKWHSDVPVYDVVDFNGLNRIIGYVKHNNNEGMVLYRGQCKLYESLTPSIQRDSDSFEANEIKLKEVLRNLYQDTAFNKAMSWNDEVKGWKIYIETTCEAALQHYGAKTNCIDFVDNHWTALWFSINEYDSSTAHYFEVDEGALDDGEELIIKDPYFAYNPKPPHSKQQNKTYQVKLQKRRMEENEYSDRCLGKHAFLFLYLAEMSVSEICGLHIGKESYTVDLRKALPGIFLRPVSQHGWIVKGREVSFDFDKNVICVLRLQNKMVKEFLGNGSLLSQEHFFPSPEYDSGYRFLLSRQEDNKYERKNLPNLLPKNMISTTGMIYS